MENQQDEIQLILNQHQRGTLVLTEQGVQLGIMQVAIEGNNLIVYHTESYQHGAGHRLLEAMVDHARTHHLQVVPLCPYVHRIFAKHPDQYEDVWNHSWHP